MTKISPPVEHASLTPRARSRRCRAAVSAETNYLATAIRRPAEVLAAAAAEASNGMLGGAKLGLLVAAAGLCDALKAVDAEFARRYAGDGAANATLEAAPLSPVSGMPAPDGRG